MSRQQGLFPFSANFEPRIASPLDSRLVANTVSNLTDVAYWTSGDGGVYLYKGISVNVWNDTVSNNGIYVLIDDDYTDIDNWLKVGSSGSGGTFSSIETGPGLTVSNTNGTYSISIEDTTAGQGLTFSNGIFDINWGGTASGLTFSNDNLMVNVDGITVTINNNGELSVVGSNITPQYLTSSGDILSIGLTISGTVSLYSRLQVFINGIEESVGLSAGTGASLPPFSNQSIIFDNGVLTWNDSGAGYTLDSNDEVRILYGS